MELDTITCAALAWLGCIGAVDLAPGLPHPMGWILALLGIAPAIGRVSVLAMRAKPPGRVAASDALALALVLDGNGNNGDNIGGSGGQSIGRARRPQTNLQVANLAA